MWQESEMITLLGSLLGDALSHPDKKLIEHLTGVAKKAFYLSKWHRCLVDEDKLSCICLTHDLGKFDERFQKYLLGKGKGVNHAFVSAMFTLSRVTDFIGAEVVRRHHGSLKNLADAANDWFADKALSYDDMNKDMIRLLPTWEGRIVYNTWQDIGDEFLFEQEFNIQQWCEAKTLFSLLVAADRLDALNVDIIANNSFSSHVTYSERKFLAHDDMAKWRADVRTRCLENAGQCTGKGIYSLTLPTGTGKTLIGLKIAHEFAQKKESNLIIYALPFISIVEQNALEAATVFGEECVQEDHSLVKYDVADRSKKDFAGEVEAAHEKMALLFRYWHKKVVVTTLAHLWETMFSVRANDGMNFHKLSNAVILIDEPQGIAPELWQGFSEFLKFAAEEMNTTTILMTATQPQIARDVAKEIAPESIIVPVKRHAYQYNSAEIGMAEMIAIAAEESINGDAGLIVLNTKQCALDVYDLAKENIENIDEFYFLSTWMTPKHRREVLRKIKEREAEIRETGKGAKYLLVATQVVEAGTDLDFAWVIRDFGPLDSIIQVAGRCNRHGRRALGRVIITELCDERNKKEGKESAVKKYAQYPYNDIVLDCTRTILRKTLNFDEDEVAGLVEEYYTKIYEKLRSNDFWDEISKGSWASVPALIEKKRMDEVTVIIETDDLVRVHLQELDSIESSLENRGKKMVLMREIQQYSISVAKKFLDQWISNMSSIETMDELPPISQIMGESVWFITKDGVSAGIYDEGTGFRPLKDSNTYDCI